MLSRSFSSCRISLIRLPVIGPHENDYIHHCSFVSSCDGRQPRYVIQFKFSTKLLSKKALGTQATINEQK